MRAEVGLGIQSDKTPGEYARLAVQAERFGIDVLSVYADLWFQPPLPALLEMAAATSRVRLGAACWNPYTLHPYEIAGQVAAVSAVSNGRVYLGLARGTWLRDLGISQPRPLAHLREAAAVIRALLSGDDAGLEGEFFPLVPGSRLRYELPAELPRLLIGTWGAKTAAWAGEVADELKIGGTVNPAMLPVMRDRLRTADTRGESVGLVVGAVCVIDENAKAARALARREVAMYLAVVAELDPTVEVDPQLIWNVRRLVESGDSEAAGRRIPDDVLDLFAFAGSPEHVAGQAQRLIDAGASRVEFGTPHGLSPTSGIELLGRRVLPLLDLG